MTNGLVRSCNTTYLLFKKFKCKPTEENEVAYTKYRYKLNSILNKAEKDFYHKKISDCQGDQKQTWKIINSIMTKNNNAKSKSHDFIIDNQNITDDNIVANKFNDYLLILEIHLHVKLKTLRIIS